MAGLDGHHQIGQIGWTIDRVATDPTAEVVGIDVAIGGLAGAGIDLVAVGEFHNVGVVLTASVNARHLHVVAELVRKGKVSRIGVALGTVVNDWRARTSILGNRRRDVIKDLIELSGIGCCEIIIGVGLALGAHTTLAELKITEVACLPVLRILPWPRHLINALRILIAT